MFRFWRARRGRNLAAICNNNLVPFENYAFFTRRAAASSEPDPGIYDDVNHIGKYISHKQEQTRDDQYPEGHGVIALQNRGVAEIAHPIDIEHLLDQKRARQDQADYAAEAGGDRNQRVPQRMNEDDPALTQPFCEGGTDKILSERLQQRILG